MMNYDRVKKQIGVVLGNYAVSSMRFSDVIQCVFFYNYCSDLYIQISKFGCKYEVRICDMAIKFISVYNFSSFKKVLDLLQSEYSHRFVKSHFVGHFKPVKRNGVK